MGAAVLGEDGGGTARRGAAVGVASAYAPPFRFNRDFDDVLPLPEVRPEVGQSTAVQQPEEPREVEGRDRAVDSVGAPAVVDSVASSSLVAPTPTGEDSPSTVESSPSFSRGSQPRDSDVFAVDPSQTTRTTRLTPSIFAQYQKVHDILVMSHRGNPRYAVTK